MRTFTATNRKRWSTSGAEELDPADPRWRAMHDQSRDGACLWLIHGTGKQCHEGFGFFEPPELARMHTHYGDQVYGWDHFTLLQGIAKNVEDLRARMPDQPLELALDIVAISRGGLLARFLAEGHAAALLSPHRIRVRSLVFVGTPNRGTPQAVSSRKARQALRKAMAHDSAQENLVGFSDDLDLALAAPAWRLFPGQEAMVPGSALLEQLESPVAFPGGRPTYYAVAATFPAGREPEIDDLFSGEAHDLIVPTAGVYDLAHPRSLFPIPPSRRLALGDAANHHHLLRPDLARSTVLQWLGVPP